MGGNTAPQRPIFAQGEVRLCSCAFADQLDSSELLTGTPTVAEQTTTDLTITNKAINTSSFTMLGETYTAGQVVQFLVSGMLTTRGWYRIKVTCSTDATPTQTVIGFVEFDVE